MEYPHTEIGYQTESEEEQQACIRGLYYHDRPGEEDAGRQGVPVDMVLLSQTAAFIRPAGPCIPGYRFRYSE